MTAPVVQAEFSGHCPSCDYSIHIGDPITWTEDGWHHRDCRPDASPPPRPIDVCQRCWLVKPCDCEEPT